MIRYQHLLFAVCLALVSIPTASFAFSLPQLFVTSKPQTNQYELRIQAWKNLIIESKDDNDWQKLNKVNQFFNRINFIADKTQWGVEDYWASPLEFLTRNAGDCEDYSIAKYFTLKAMGVSVDRLRITYVTTFPDQQAHMVLVYLEGGDKTPLVLDNLQREIVPFILRLDLDPVYSFNHNGLWLAHREPGKEQFVSASTKQVGHWQRVSDKIGRES